LQANAPEIERINAHIKQLEDAVLAEREACAEMVDSYVGFDSELSESIRARGKA